jgi:hypothetical protein
MGCRPSNNNLLTISFTLGSNRDRSKAECSLSPYDEVPEKTNSVGCVEARKCRRISLFSLTGMGKEFTEIYDGW